MFLVAACLGGCSITTKTDGSGGNGTPSTLSNKPSPTGGDDTGDDDDAQRQQAQQTNLQSYMLSLLSGDVVQTSDAVASSDASDFAEAFFLAVEGGGLATQDGAAWNLCPSNTTFGPSCLRLSNFDFDYTTNYVRSFDIEGQSLYEIGESTRDASLVIGKYATTTLRGYFKWPSANKMTVAIGYSWLENMTTTSGCDPKAATYSVNGVSFPVLASDGGGGDGSALEDLKMHLVFETTETGGYVSLKCYGATTAASETHKIYVL